jgi:hypothetical protein
VTREEKQEWLGDCWGSVVFRNLAPNYHVHLSGGFPCIQGGESFTADSPDAVVEFALRYTVYRIQRSKSVMASLEWLTAVQDPPELVSDLIARERERLSELKRGMVSQCLPEGVL